MKEKWYITGNYIRREFINDFMEQHNEIVADFVESNPIDRKSIMQKVLSVNMLIDACKFAITEIRNGQADTLIIEVLQTAIDKAEGK